MSDDDVWGTAEGSDDDSQLMEVSSQRIQYVELPERSSGGGKPSKCNEASCPGCFTACRRSVSLSTVSIVFLSVATFDTVLSVAVAGLLLANTNDTNAQELFAEVYTVPNATNGTTVQPGEVAYDQLLFYSLAAIFITVGFILLSFDAVIGENNLQLVAAVVTSVLMTAYVIFKYFSSGFLGPLWAQIRLYVLIIKLVCQVTYFGIFYSVSQSFGFKDSKIIGSSESILSCYAGYKRYLAATWVDFELCVVFFLMFGLLDNNFNVNSLDGALCSVFLAVEIGFLLYGWYCIVDERNRSMYAWYAVSCLQIGFVIYKLIEKATGVRAPDELAGVTSTQFYIVGALNLVGRVFYIAFGIACHRNFGEGLLQSFTRG